MHVRVGVVAKNRAIVYIKRLIHCKSGGNFPVSGGQLVLVVAKVTTTNHMYTHCQLSFDGSKSVCDSPVAVLGRRSI